MSGIESEVQGVLLSMQAPFVKGLGGLFSKYGSIEKGLEKTGKDMAAKEEAVNTERIRGLDEIQGKLTETTNLRLRAPVADGDLARRGFLLSKGQRQGQTNQDSYALDAEEAQRS